MASLLHVIAIALVLTVSLVSGSFPKRKLDCSGVISNFPLNEYENHCSFVVQPTDTQFSLMNRLDIVEMCTCALLRRTFVWEALVTHEVELIYYSARKLLEYHDESHKNVAPSADDVKRDNLILQNNPDGIMDFWDRFGLLLLEVNAGGKEGAILSNKFLDTYTDNYYKPEDFKINFKGEGGTANFRKQLSATCNQLFRSSSPFIYLFGNLRKLSENTRFVYRVLTYNENLYKIMISVKMCKFLSNAGIVTEIKSS